MGLWNLNGFPFDPIKLSSHLKSNSLFTLLNSDFIRKKVGDFLKKESNGKTRLENLVEKYSKDDRPLLERVFRDPETVVPYIIFDHLRKLFNLEKKNFPAAIENPRIKRAVLNVTKTIEKYGVNLPMVFAEPLMLVWNTTAKCNLRCKHCYEDAGVLSRGLPNELTKEEKVKVMEEICKLNIPTFAFAGGEPLMDPMFWELARIGKENGLYMSINTNGTLITEEVAWRLKEIGFAYYGVSLDGASPEVHDAFRGMKGSFERAIRGIKNLVKAGEGDKTCISFTVARENAILQDEIPKMLKLRDELGIRKIVCYNYIPCGRADMRNDLTCEERERLFEIFYRDLQNGKETLLSTAPQFGRYCRQMYERGEGRFTVLGHFSSGNNEKLESLVELIGGCGAGRAYLSLQPDGSITPCVFMPNLVIGNIKKGGEIKGEHIIEVWDTSPIMAKIRNRRKHLDKCGCRGKYFSVCGGCVARAYAYFGDLEAPDPGCILNRGILEKFSGEEFHQVA
ncbi:MAG: radical SAM protein [Caldiserica bacterium]|nr:radical SAM protein [Caldisericota bacterium]